MFSINTAAIAGQNTNLNVSGPYGLSKEALLKVLKAAKVSLSFTRPLMDVRMNFCLLCTQLKSQTAASVQPYNPLAKPYNPLVKPNNPLPKSVMPWNAMLPQKIRCVDITGPDFV